MPPSTLSTVNQCWRVEKCYLLILVNTKIPLGTLQKKKRQILDWCAPGRADFKEVDWNQVWFLGVWLPLMSMGSVAVAVVSLGCRCCLKYRGVSLTERCLCVATEHKTLNICCRRRENKIWSLKVWCAFGREVKKSLLSWSVQSQLLTAVSKITF